MRHGNTSKFLAVTIGWMTGLLIVAGCSPSAMKEGDLSLVQTFSDKPRAGNVYLLRGFIGIWSTGIDNIGKRINEAGVRANVYRCEQWRELTDTLVEKYKNQKDYEPLIIIGHSWGADHSLELAQALEEAGVMVDLIITLDPVTPPVVPKNIKRVYNIYQTNGAWDNIPIFRGVALTPSAGLKNVENINIREDRTDLLEPGTDHYNIEKKQKIHEEVLKQVLATCPPRAQWVAQHPASRTTSQSPLTAGQKMPAPSSGPPKVSNTGNYNPGGGP